MLERPPPLPRWSRMSSVNSTLVMMSSTTRVYANAMVVEVLSVRECRRPHWDGGRRPVKDSGRPPAVGRRRGPRVAAPSVARSAFGGLAELADPGELLGAQARAAHQGAVDVRLRHDA